MDNGEHVIRTTGLRRRYGPAKGRGGKGRGEDGFEAVRGLDLEVARGELFALLGTNGAGKTSTVELLEGLAAPSAGKVEIFGSDPFRERDLVRPRIGIMLQEGGFPTDLTVAETAQMWEGMTTGARPVGEALEMVGLGKREKVRVKQLSGGERRRLDLGLALLGRPEVLFLDEPTTGMDAEGRQDTWRLVRELQAEGTTVLLTTHYLEEAEQLADRVAIMRDGRVVTLGTPDEVTASQEARIRFRLPAGVTAAHLPLSVPAAVRGDRVEVRTKHLQEAMIELLLWAREQNLELPGLEARSGSLEDAFLDIARQDHDLPDGAPDAHGTAPAAARTAQPTGEGAHR